ncbi:MAG TPA: hypothetical protein VEJ84_14645 [Acidimicrobiales bacterium]|nr:hypothetical protein [Acidimicrobiales bacterium]
MGVAVLLFVAEAALVARRRGYLFGANTVVRCRSGHLFTTLWLPGVSVKSLRLGWWRFQRCPAGKHWTFITPVNPSDLPPQERQLAAQVHDVFVP